MGRIKTTLVKRKGKEIYQSNPKVFKEKFAENKKLVQEHAEMDSKKLRNIIAGYITRMVKKNKKEAI